MPTIDIKDNVIVFSKRFPDDSANSERLKTEIENQVKSLASAAQNVTRDVERHNNEVPQKIRDALQQKRARAHDAVAAISELGIPIKRRDEAPTFTVPTKRRRSFSQSYQLGNATPAIAQDLAEGHVCARIDIKGYRGSRAGPSADGPE